MENAKKFFGANLRQAIDNRGLTYGKAAETIGVSLSFVNQLMRGENGPSLEMIFQISERLKCPVSELFGEAETQKLKLDMILRLFNIAATLDEDQLRTILGLAERQSGATPIDRSLITDQLSNKSKRIK